MGKIYTYFKKEIDSNKILVRINPSTMEGLEILVSSKGKITQTERLFDDTIYTDLEFDEFAESSPLEFNLYLSGAAK